MRSIAFTIALCLMIPGTARATVRPFAGFFYGFGGLTPTDEFYKRAGRGRTTTREGLQPNTSVVRDAPGRAGALAFGVNGGVEFFPLLAAEARGKYVTSIGGGGQHYFRGGPAIIGAEDAAFRYAGASVDVGPRVCLSVFCLRPFVGIQTYAIYKFVYGKDNGESFSQDDEAQKRTIGGEIRLHIPFGKARVPALNVGVEYEEYNSNLGGKTSMILLTIGMDFAFLKDSSGR